MTMKRTNIYLDHDLDRLLRYLALEQGRSFTDLVREALLDYVTREGFPDPARVIPPKQSVQDDAWRASFVAAIERLRATVPADLAPEEIDAEIDAAVAEARAERWGSPTTASHD
jgi:hypothetical protein